VITLLHNGGDLLYAFWVWLVSGTLIAGVTFIARNAKPGKQLLEKARRTVRRAESNYYARKRHTK